MTPPDRRRKHETLYNEIRHIELEFLGNSGIYILELTMEGRSANYKLIKR